MSDIVERLRREGETAQSKHLSMGMWQLCTEAAAEIERLREALRIIWVAHQDNDALRRTFLDLGVLRKP